MMQKLFYLSVLMGVFLYPSIVCAASNNQLLASYDSVIASAQNQDQGTEAAKYLQRIYNTQQKAEFLKNGGRAYYDTKNLVDITDPKISQSIYQKISWNPHSYKDPAQFGFSDPANGKPFKPTVGQQVEMVGLLFGEDKAKEYAQQFAAAGFSANSSFDEFAATVRKNPSQSSNIGITNFVEQNVYGRFGEAYGNRSGATYDPIAYGQELKNMYGIDVSLGDRIQDGLKTTLNTEVKGALIKQLGEYVDIPKEKLAKLSRSDLSKLSSYYLGVTLDDAVDDATDKLFSKMGFDMSDLENVETFDDLREIGWELPETADERYLSGYMADSQYMLGLMTADGIYGTGLSEISDLVDESVDESISGEVNSGTSSDFAIENIDLESISDFQYSSGGSSGGGSSGGWSGGSGFASGSGSGWKIM